MSEPTQINAELKNLLPIQFLIAPLKYFLDVEDQVLMLNGHEQRIMWLNYIFKKFGMSSPYAAVTKREFETFWRFSWQNKNDGPVIFRLSECPPFFCPRIDDFMVLIMKRLQ